MEYSNNSRGGQTPAGGGSGTPRKKKKKKISVGGIIGRIVLTLFTLCVIGVLTIAIFFKIFMTYVDTTLLPSLETETKELTMGLASTVYYQDNDTGEWVELETLYTSGSNRELVTFDQIPDHLIQALVSIEDHRFWEHHGVDWQGTAAAIVQTVTGGNTRGGSTITQQVLRAITDDKEVTVKRKFREIFRALEYEKTHSKEEILTEYLNRAYFGHGCDGIQTAAQTYFGKNVWELDLAESACIVGITNAPSLYDPLSNTEIVQKDGSVKTTREYNKERQELILDKMVEYGYISQAECDAAKAETLIFTDSEEYQELHSDGEGGAASSDGKVFSWFMDAVYNDAIDLIAEARGCTEEMASELLYSAGYQIYTTLDMDIQNIVDSVYEDPSNFDYPSANGTPLSSAITITDPYTGDVVAMAGGVGEKTESLSLSLATSRRPCGSAIKPLSVYAPAIENNVVGPGSVIDDYPIRLNDSGTGGYPKNSNNKYVGPVTVSYAVQQSINTVACRVLEMLGYATSFEFMENNLGFDLDERDIGVGPLAMGGLTYGVTTEEMAAAYGAFANSGIYSKPRTITQILSNDGKEVIVDNPVQSTVAMKESTAYLVNKMLRSVVSSGTGTSASFSGMTIAGKTGTTTNNFDRYFVGYTPYYSAAVWIGYADGNEKITASGNFAAKVWKMVMEQVHAGLEDKSFPDQPAGIVSVQVCADCGLKPSALCSQDYRGSRVITVEMQEGAVPTETCTCHVETQFCSESNMLAGEFCPEDCRVTRVVLQGRTFLEVPYSAPVTNEDGTVTTGWPILATDSDAHLTYLQTQGTCNIHTEDYVDPDVLVPGDEGWEWPDWWPWGDGSDDEDPADPEEPADPDDSDDTGESLWPFWPEEDPDQETGEPAEPDEPSEPEIPEEPLLP